MRYLSILAIALLAACGGNKQKILVAPKPAAALPGLPAAAPAPEVADASPAPEAAVAANDRSSAKARTTDIPDLSALDTGDDPKRTVAGLGDPARAGLWMETPLVTSQRQGRVVVAGSARAATVTLIPVEGPAGAGSRLSLQAMQVLNVPLTELVTLEVYRGG